MTVTKIGSFVDNASVANIQTQLRLLAEELPDNYSLDLFYHEECPISLNKHYDPHEIQLAGSPFTTQNVITNILSRIYSFTKAGREYIKNSEPDAIIGFTNPPVMGTAAGLAAQGTTTTAIYRYSGDSFQEYKLASNLSKPLAYSHYNIIGRLALSVCDKFIVLGPNGCDALSQRGVENQQIYTIPPLIDRKKFYPGESAVDTGTRDTVGLFVGRLDKRKGADRLKQIINRILNRRKDIKFIILGKGPMMSELEAISDESVHLEGYVPHSEIAKYYRAADFLIHPSRIEGLPNVLLEAHACGIPTVTSNVGELTYYSDFTAESIEGYIDAIQEILDKNEIIKKGQGLSTSNIHSVQKLISCIA